MYVGFAIETGKLSGEDTVLVVEMFGSTSFATKNVTPDAQKPVQVAAIPQVASTITPAVAKDTNNINNAKPETLALQKINTNQKLASTSLSQVNKPLVNGVSFSVLSARIVISLFIFVLILDMIIIERKKILRFVGHNLDHVIFLSLLLLIIIILARGAIL